ncbi:MAG: hypothetical protein CSB19_00990 [Clostridiales bacterium]|nr:MAG: hypothetical protein CSB19_00990 [Clostridiales bacterium]
MASLKSFCKRIDIANNYSYVLFFVVLCLSIALLVNTFIFSVDQAEFIYAPKNAAPVMIKNVTLRASNGASEQVELPVKRPSDNAYSYSFVVAKDATGMQQCVNVVADYTSYYIRYKDEIIYSSSTPRDSVVSSVPTAFDIIEIPNKFLGKELQIEFISNLKSDRPLRVPELLIGTKSGIRKYYFYMGLPKILASIALFITAIFIAVIGVFFIVIGQNARNLFIAVLFAIIMSLYIVLRAPIVFYFINNSILGYYIEYTCLMLIPVPIYLLFLNVFYENDYLDWRTKSFEILVVMLIVNFVVQWLLTLSGISEFVLMQGITLGLLAIAGFYLCISVFTLDGSRVRNKNLLVISIAPLASLMLVDIFDYYKTFVVPKVPFIIFSVAFFMTIQFVLAFKKYTLDFNAVIENEFYSQLAYIDSLTQLSNRHDFEKDVQAIVAGEITFNNMYLIMTDMNHLKTINDTYGHKMGDAYLKAAGEMFLELEKRHRRIKAYRYGGDEFIVLAYDKRARELEKIIRDIKRLSYGKKHDCEYALDFAVGYSLCPNQASFELFSFKDEADNRMYADKQCQKEARAHAR